jgi:hypothetical protein
MGPFLFGGYPAFLRLVSIKVGVTTVAARSAREGWMVSCNSGNCSGTVPVPRLTAGGTYHVPVRPRGVLSGVH